jgi:hypothetical protein
MTLHLLAIMRSSTVDGFWPKGRAGIILDGWYRDC